MAFGIEEEILGLEVAVGDAGLGLVKELKHKDDLSGVEAGGGFVEAAELAQISKELAAGNVIENHVEGVAVGKGGDEVGDKRMAGDVGENGSLVADVVELLEPDNVCFVEYLEGEDEGGWR